MMKRFLTCLMIAGMLMLSLSACKHHKEDLLFYVVEAEDLPADAAENTLLSIAKEHGRIAFTGENIENWYWETHRVALKGVDVKGGSGKTGSSLFQADAEDVFMLVLGSKVLLYGGFENNVGALTLDRDPYIADDAGGDAFHLLCRKTYAEGEDPRQSTVLYDFLAEHNLLASEI